MKKSYVIMLLMLAVTSSATLFAQNSNVGIGTTTPDATAVLDVTSSSKGVLVPRMGTTARLAITSPAQGLLVYDTDLGCFYYYNTTTSAWVSLCQAGPAGPTGAQGAAGVAGVAGATGPSGADGVAGANGAQGPAGAAGPAGANGAAGPAGAAGAPGAAGPAGANGATGPAGTNGTNGANGATGPAGANGAAGPTGPQGTAGAGGATGPAGAAGAAGATGPTGANGFVSSNIVSLISGGTNPLVANYPSGANITYVQLPNLTYTVTLNAASKIVVLAFGSTSKATNDFTTVYSQYAIYLDGVNTNIIQRVSIESNQAGQYQEVPWGISTVLSVAAGTHTVAVYGAHAGGDGVAPNDAVWLCTPSGYVGQATMNVLITQ